MHKYAETFAIFCEKEFELNDNVTYDYKSLSLCIIDCVYSLRAKYDSVTVSVVKRYADYFLNGDIENSSETISMFLNHFDELQDFSLFADIVDNHQKLGRNCIPKENVCYQIAKYLSYLHIETIDDFQNFESPEFLEKILLSVNGMGNAGVNYLFMLVGDSDRCKVDVHINRCVKEACGCDLPDNEIQRLFKDTVAILKKTYPNITVRSLDGIIWRIYQLKTVTSN